MSVAGAIILVAVGAILRYAVSDSINGVDLQTIGLILMIAGAAGFVLTLLLEFGGRSRRTERIVEREGRPVEREDIRERY
jgi:uncharacterized protein DUF6458